MVNKRFVILVLVVCLFSPVICFAEIIVLKSGKTVEGKLIEKTDKYIKIDFEGIPLTYFFEEIASINGEALDAIVAEEEKIPTGKPPEDFHTEGRRKIEKNDKDDVWEMTIQGIEPMYADPDSRRGKSQKEMDESITKTTVEQYGSKEDAVLDVIASAWEYFNGGYPNIAMRKFNFAWSLDPKNAEVYYGFGCILSSRQELDGAIKMYSEAIKLDLKYYDAYANRGLDYCAKQEFDKAISDFTRAIEINPNEKQTYNDRAVAYFFLQKYDKAWVDLHRAEELGYAVNPEFIAMLKKASGRDK